MILTAVFTECEEGGYRTTIEEIPGVITEGDTSEEVLELIMESNREEAEKSFESGRSFKRIYQYSLNDFHEEGRFNQAS